MKKILKGLCLLLGAGFIFTACNKTPEQKAEYMVEKVTDKLDLNENQVSKLNELKDQILLVKKDRSSDKKEMYADVKKMLLSERIESNDVKDLIDRKEKIISDEFSGVFTKFQDFHATLSTKQKEKAVAIIEKFKKKRGFFCHK